MSESQFAYSGLTLDELRALAASPQVGTLHAMPQSFRALADRVGEVADLLTHTQVNMHHWWKGPAAEQAAAMLGQAAAEAREFHDTAMGAATAVGHCAQIVSEQQHQMMNVPEVAEPGVTDVVPRPTTPFEALEAARRDAAYQAAHEQAVQVVNGIAAQYVETRSRLAEIGTFRAENFVPVAASPQSPEPHLEPTAGAQSYTREHQAPRNLRGGQHSRASMPASPNTREVNLSSGRTSASPIMTTHESRYYGSSSASSPKPNSTSREIYHQNETSGEVNQPAGADIGQARESTTNKTPITVAREAQDRIRDEYDTESYPVPIEPEFRTPVASNLHTARENSHHIFGRNVEIGTTETSPGSARVGEVPPGNSTQSQWASGDNAAMIPPYAGVGSVHRLHEERNRRPAYLKERKSVWVTEKIAAPADGVLTPDWFERH